jgi:hypothetical protein
MKRFLYIICGNDSFRLEDTVDKECYGYAAIAVQDKLESLQKNQLESLRLVGIMEVCEQSQNLLGPTGL